MFRCRAHHLQGPHYSCLLKLHFVKVVNYGTSVYEEIGGDVVCSAPKHVGAILVYILILFLRQSLVH
jgi:hypothetical protein